MNKKKLVFKFSSCFNLKIILTSLIVLTAIVCGAEKIDKFNLGFEKQDPENVLSDGWDNWGTQELSIDSMSYSGDRSGRITSSEDGQFGCIVYKIPAHYTGNIIKLEGYIKINNVEKGFAGFILRVDDFNGEVLVFDNMKNQNISGTREWQKYSVELEYPEEAETIYIAGILVGKGDAWFDDFYLTIDGKNVQTLKETPRPVFKANLDKEFDAGSEIEISHLTIEGVDDLELLGRVWGFLKYYHPEIAKGNYNWDYELFRFLPDYLSLNNREAKEELLLKWIISFGYVKQLPKMEENAEKGNLKPDLKWIKKYIKNELLKNKLMYVYNNRNRGDHFYVASALYVGNPIFKNENSYSNMPYPDSGYRLLSLYRYWNMITYFFPNKHLTDKDWNNTLKEYIPTFLNAQNELEYELAAIQLIADIKDTHASVWRGNDKIEEWKGDYYAPVHLRFIENKLVVTDYYNPELKNEAGLDIGDVISKIDGKSVNDIILGLSKYYPASNNLTRLRNLSTDMLRSAKNELEIEFISDGDLKTKMLKLYPKSSLDIYHWYRESSEKCFKLLDNNIGYITLQTIKESDIPEIKRDFKDTKGIIIDIRNYPSTYVPYKLGSFFVSESTPFVKFSISNITNPGEFTYSDILEIPECDEYYKGKLIVLVNELSQSQAEYTAMAFRAGDNTTIIGSTTAGADGNVSPIFLPGGLKTMISGIGVYYPNGTETQRVGIIPDIEVKPTIEGIKAGRDELMEKAIELILSEKSR